MQKYIEAKILKCKDAKMQNNTDACAQKITSRIIATGCPVFFCQFLNFLCRSNTAAS